MGDAVYEKQRRFFVNGGEAGERCPAPALFGWA
jgi:hypothetical protein